MHRCRLAFANPFSRRFALVTALRRLGLALLLGPIAFPLAPALLAQTAGTGAIAGSITDPSGASVAEAQVKAINEATGEVRTAVSTVAGNYAVPLLLPGVYTLEISKTGFKLVQAPHVSVVVTETKTFNVRMELGQIADKVIVEALAEQLQTQSSALGEVTSGDQVRTLPLVNRNYTQIISLNPGVAAEVTDAGAIGRGDVGLGGAPIVANGGWQGDNNVQMNGVGINDLQSSGYFSGGVAIPNPDTIEEFKVQT
ncbi:MAG: carboxypeptidase regulatory-like domain-containing protein, partial [Acidobacteria bacterium Pan2503]|nr:carboxypeptidase regulatory-like domain-containing protein [Candidatus Acidoferrum panamensis]